MYSKSPPGEAFTDDGSKLPAFLAGNMVPIQSRSEFPDEDDDLDEARLGTHHHHFRTENGDKITRSPGSNSRPRGQYLVPPDAVSPPSYLGTTIDGRYFVEKQLGEGGMGVVYQCRHTIIDKRVAIKVLRPDLARNEEVTERFLNEARSASSIGNPHIIDISDFGRLPDGTAYFVMEFLTGTSLADVVDSGEELEPGRVGHIALQLCEGLAAAHSAGIIHRDLKPDNIFLVDQGSRKDFVKILDFGIAKATRVAARLTQAGQVFGTPHYMSPEQASGADVDLRSDIYAVGVILYELATGQLPFDADNFMAILTQHMYKEPPPPSVVDGSPELLPGFEDVILKCMAKAPLDRYQSLVDLMSDLRLVFSDVLPVRPAERVSGTGFSSKPALLHAHARPSRPQPLPPQEAPEFHRVSTPNMLPTPELLAASGKKAKPGSHWLLYAGIGLSAALLAGSVVWGLTSRKPELAPVEVAAAQPAQVNNATSTQEQAIAAVKTVRVAVAVVPLQAHVFLGETDLGESPVMVEVGSEPIVLEGRLAGYERQTVRVDGSQTKLSLVLRKKPTPDSTTSGPSGPTAKPSSTKTAPTTKPPPARTHSSSDSGVVNPWN